MRPLGTAVDAAVITLKALVGLGRGMHTHPGRSLRGIARKHPVTELVIHESVSQREEDEDGERISGGRHDPEDILAARGLSVHAVVQSPNDGDTDVEITTHVPYELAAVHAGRWHNRRSIAIEVETLYTPPGGAAAAERVHHKLNGSTDVLIGVWVWKRRRRKHKLYKVPPVAQLEALWQLVERLCNDERFEIPLAFPAVDPAKGFRWGRSKRHKQPGVKAHHRWHHADGLVPECYCWLRSLGLPWSEAYATTVQLASAGRRWTKPPRGIA